MPDYKKGIIRNISLKKDKLELSVEDTKGDRILSIPSLLNSPIHPLTRLHRGDEILYRLNRNAEVEELFVQAYYKR